MNNINNTEIYEESIHIAFGCLDVLERTDIIKNKSFYTEEENSLSMIQESDNENLNYKGIK